MSQYQIFDENNESTIKGRKAIWEAICFIAESLSGSCSFYLSEHPDNRWLIRKGTEIPDEKTWQLMELLSFLSVLMKADKVVSKKITNVLRHLGPVHFIENGQDRFIWTQSTVKGDLTSLDSRPDILVTNSSNTPSVDSIIRVIECKSGRKVGSQIIRSEFGKAYDLKVTSYLIWSYYSVKEKLITSSKNLGIDLEVLNFDTKKGAELIANPEILAYTVANIQEASSQSSNFSNSLLKSTDKIKSKLLLT